jgi:hypothetical protein
MEQIVLRAEMTTAVPTVYQKVSEAAGCPPIPLYNPNVS